MSNAFRIFLLLEICCTHGNQVWKGNDPALALPDFSLKLFHFELFVINRARELSRKNGRGDRKFKLRVIKASPEQAPYLQWRPIQMRVFHSNESGLFCTQPPSVAPLFWWKERGKQEALI